LVSERLRLKDVDAAALAVELGRALQATMAEHLSLFGQDSLAGAVRFLAAYARGEVSDASVLERQLEIVSRLYRSPMGAVGLPTTEPTNALELVIAAARARQSLDAGRDIGAQELAILAGMNWPYISQLAAGGAIPGAYRVGKEQDKRRPWRFRASKALKKWIDEKNS
jgi:hypothetical protein